MNINPLFEFFKRQNNLPLKAGFVAAFIHYFLVINLDEPTENSLSLLLLTPSYLIKRLLDFELLTSNLTLVIFSSLVYGLLAGLLFSKIPVLKAFGVLLILILIFGCLFFAALIFQSYA
jgi:hypothetical protein